MSISLFQPIRIGDLVLSNRVFMAPLTRMRSSQPGDVPNALMAEYYARLTFDQALHDRLLSEVLAADPVEPGFTLMNVLAQQRAAALVESGKDYF